MPGHGLQRAAEAGGVAEGEEMLGGRAVPLPEELGLDAAVGGFAVAVAAADGGGGNGAENLHGIAFRLGLSANFYRCELRAR